MTADELRALQAPLKERYKTDPAAAQRVLRAEGTLVPESCVCRLTGRGATVEAGLHEAVGGDGRWACSGDMLLESLVACAGVTCCVVATALGIPLSGGRVVAEGELDFRGTLGVARDVPIGFSALRLRFELATTATDDQLATLLKLSERYCVIWQTLRTPAAGAATVVRIAADR